MLYIGNHEPADSLRGHVVSYALGDNLRTNTFAIEDDDPKAIGKTFEKGGELKYIWLWYLGSDF